MKFTDDVVASTIDEPISVDLAAVLRAKLDMTEETPSTDAGETPSKMNSPKLKPRPLDEEILQKKDEIDQNDGDLSQRSIRTDAQYVERESTIYR